MNISAEAYEVLIIVGVIAAAMAITGYLTHNSRNFRSSRNKKARKQHHSKFL